MDPGEVIGNRRYLLQAGGTSQFQNELELIVGARVKESAHHHATAFLVPEEPKNHNDPNAIQVQIEDYLVGYLDRRATGEYRAAFGRKPPIVCACQAIIVGEWHRDGEEDAYFGVRLDADMPFRLVLPPTFMGGLIFGDPREGFASQARGALNDANALQTSSDSLRIPLQRRMVLGSAGIIAVLGIAILGRDNDPVSASNAPDSYHNAADARLRIGNAQREAQAQWAADARQEEQEATVEQLKRQAIDAENAKAVQAKKIAARRAALKTIAPIEPDAVISDGFEKEGVINDVVTMVRSFGYRCDSVSALRPFFWSGRGAVLTCNRYNYVYDIADKGGHWVVTVE